MSPLLLAFGALGGLGAGMLWGGGAYGRHEDDSAKSWRDRCPAFCQRQAAQVTSIAVVFAEEMFCWWEMLLRVRVVPEWVNDSKDATICKGPEAECLVATRT